MADLGITLVADSVAAEVVAACAGAGVRALLLRGPAIAHWLYAEGEERAYVDVDLLADPAGYDRMRSVLDRLGFAPGPDPGGRPHHAETWSRRGTMVDLHRTLAGIGASPDELWSAFGENAEEIQIGATRIMVPPVTARALTVALHAGFHGGRGTATGDLERLLNRLGRDEWTDVVALANRLQAVPGLAAGLRQLREGAALADSLDLPDRYPLHTTLLASATSGVSLNLEWLLQLDGTKAKLAFAVRRVVPPVAVLRARSSLARRGRVGLVIAYLLRPLRILWQLLPASLALRSARVRAVENDRADLADASLSSKSTGSVPRRRWENR